MDNNHMDKFKPELIKTNSTTSRILINENSSSLDNDYNLTLNDQNLSNENNQNFVKKEFKNSIEKDIFILKKKFENEKNSLDLDLNQDLNIEFLKEKFNLIKNLHHNLMIDLVSFFIKHYSFDEFLKCFFFKINYVLSEIEKKISQLNSESLNEKSNSEINCVINLTINSTNDKNEITISSDEEVAFDLNENEISLSDEELSKIDDNLLLEEEFSRDFDLEKNFNNFYKNAGDLDKYKRTDFSFSCNLFKEFKNKFGLKNFRKNQLECINAACLNEDCFVLMSTGSGKSICYQLPAIINKGVTIVISPLRSLIQDQIQKLRLLGIKAETLSPDIISTSIKEVNLDLKKNEPQIKLLYVTPEKISASKRLMKIFEILYSNRCINRFVIDEAHCVSNWGHDFRPDYKKLSILREKFCDIPLMALTATATNRVGLDIMKQLKMRNPACFLQSFNRPNLKFEVKEKSKTALEDIINLIKKKFMFKSGIIYCLSRYESEQVSFIINKSGIKSRPYHAGLTDKLRFKIQEDWVLNKFHVVCATIAFGMGIDKPDVRFIIHYSAPKSIEGYYQECGRAGRDEKLSHCYLFYCYKDIKRLIKLFDENRNSDAWKIHVSNINQIAYYCTNNIECRTMQLLRYFGEDFDPKNIDLHPYFCDNCEQNINYVLEDYSNNVKDIIESIDKVFMNQNKKFSMSHFIDIYRGSLNAKIKSENHNKLPMHNKGKKLSKLFIERMFRKLICDDFIKENAYLIQYDVVVTYLAPSLKGKSLLDNKLKFMLPIQIENEEHDKNQSKIKKKQNTLKKTTEKDDVNFESNLNKMCYQNLIELTQKLASDNNLNYNTLIPLQSLHEMCLDLPQNKQEFLNISNITEKWFNKYGAKYLEITRNYKTLQQVSNNLEEDLSQEILFDSDDQLNECDNFKNECIVQEEFDADQPSTSKGIRKLKNDTKTKKKLKK